MTDASLLIGFCLAPLLAATGAVVAGHLFRRDVSLALYRASAVLQLLIGGLLWLRFRNTLGEFRLPISAWDYAIEFAFESYRLPFLIAYLIPLAFSLARVSQLHTAELRTIALFYQGGCSGLLVTGDIFNFFVFYELMIMAAYVLVAARGEFSASVKYMLFGAISALFLLTGIIAFYATGAYLGIPYAREFYLQPQPHQTWVYLLFGTAFFVKSAFFPAHSWVATCHAATVPLVSAFLGSYTVFVGLLGLHQRVLRPAAVTGMNAVFHWLDLLAVCTMLLPALSLCFERQFKRCIAASTVVTTGFVGLLLARGYREAAMLYIPVHALYKSLMFHLTQDLRTDGATITGPPGSLAALGLCVWMASGFFPSIIFFLKYGIMDSSPWIRVAAMLSSSLVVAGFLKFRYSVESTVRTSTLTWFAVAVLLAAYLRFPLYRPVALWKAFLELGLLAVVTWVALRIRRPDGGWASAWDGRWFPNLNFELTTPLLIFASGLLILGLAL